MKHAPPRGSRCFPRDSTGSISGKRGWAFDIANLQGRSDLTRPVCAHEAPLTSCALSLIFGAMAINPLGDLASEPIVCDRVPATHNALRNVPRTWVEQASKANDVIMKRHSDNGGHEIGNESTVA